jgi:hypothetical protein
LSTLDNFEGIVRPLFVETGTGEGETLELAARVFPECITVEQNLDAMDKLRKRFKGFGNVHLHYGHSPEVLKYVLRPETPTTFWLDAHCCGTAESMGLTQCPLLDELKVITSLDWKTPPVLLIDDAFMFDDTVMDYGGQKAFWSDRTDGFKRDEWPRVEEIDKVLSGYSRHLRTPYIFQYEAT